jgi:hypothetical protein
MTGKKQRKTDTTPYVLLREVNKRLRCEKAVIKHFKVSSSTLHCVHVLRRERDCFTDNISGWSS